MFCRSASWRGQPNEQEATGTKDGSARNSVRDSNGTSPSSAAHKPARARAHREVVVAEPELVHGPEQVGVDHEELHQREQDEEVRRAVLELVVLVLEVELQGKRGITETEATCRSRHQNCSCGTSVVDAISPGAHLLRLLPHFDVDLAHHEAHEETGRARLRVLQHVEALASLRQLHAQVRQFAATVSEP